MKFLKYVLIAIAVAVAAKLIRPSEPTVLTAAMVVAEGNKRMTFPKDLGDGLRLDSVTAKDNDVVSTITLTGEPPGPPNALLKSVLETATKSDVCREIAPAKALYARTGIRIVKTYKNSGGGEIVSVTVDPATCS